MGLYAPEIYSNNGGAQTVRFRAQIWKKESGSYVRKETGAWDRGTARPETAYVGPSQEFTLHPDGYGEGKYRARIQVQYLRADKTWSPKRTKVLRDYADYYKAQNTFIYDGDVTYCTAGPTGEGGSS